MMTIELAPQQDERTGRFLAGNNLSNGRPKGARAKLGEAFTEALRDSFERRGMDAIERVIDNDPGQYLRVIAGLLPKDVNLNLTDDREQTDEAILERIRQLDATIRPYLALAGEAGTGGAAGAKAANKGGARTPNRVH